MNKPSFSPTLQASVDAVILNLNQAGGHVLLVGGCVRDGLLGLSSRDADIEIYNLNGEDLEVRLTELFADRVHKVGRAFGVWHVDLGHDGALDIALPRHESKIAVGHQGFEVIGNPRLDVVEATRRRDFTINAILYDPQSDEHLDPFNGRDDLQNKLLRVVDAEHFGEDPLRVYRAAQFVARFGLTVEASTLELLHMMVQRGDLAELPAERITEEMRKLLLSTKPSLGFEVLRALGVIERDYPELWSLTSTPQDQEWHPEGDVWIHTMMVVDAAAIIIRRDADTLVDDEPLQIVLGALCHDLGKPTTTAPSLKHGVMHLRSLGHEPAGDVPTRTLLARWRFGDDMLCAALVGTHKHLQPSALYRQALQNQWAEMTYVNAVRKLIRSIYPISSRVLAAVAEADFHGRTLPEALGQDPAVERMRKAIVDNKLDQEPTRTLLQGADLLTLGIEPGPEIGRIIREIEALRDQGTVITREEALTFVLSSRASTANGDGRHLTNQAVSAG